MKTTETLLTQFWVIIYITSKFNLMNKTETLLTQFSVIFYITSEFILDEKNRNFIYPILGHNSQNW